LFDAPGIIQRGWQSAAGMSRLKLARVWLLKINNKSHAFTDVSLIVFAGEIGNVVKSFRVYTQNDASIHINSASVKNGALELQIGRFYKRRSIEVALVLRKPGIPLFHSSLGFVRRRVKPRSLREDQYIKGLVDRAIMEDRIALIFIQFCLAFGATMAYMFYFYLRT
jgi:hypothetical protein